MTRRPASIGSIGSIAAALLAGALAVAACRKEAPGTAAPTDAGAAEPAGGGADAAAEEPAPDDLPGLESELDRLRSELAAAQQALDATPQSEDPDGPDGAQARCQRVCDLSAAVCDLQARICALADEHAGEDRYLSACARAGGDCERSSEACRACSG